MSAVIIPFPAAATPTPVTPGNRRGLDTAVLSAVITATDALAKEDGAEHQACIAADRLLAHVLRYRWEADLVRDGVLQPVLIARDWLHLARASRSAATLRLASDHNRRRVALEEAVGTLSRATDHLRGWSSTRIREIA